MADDELVTVESYDGAQFKTEVKVAKMSGTLAKLIVDSGVEQTIPLPAISGKNLALALEFCKHYTVNPPNENELDIEPEEEVERYKIEPEKRREIKNPWAKQFCEKLDTATIIEMIAAANYLEIKQLLTVTCKSLATRLNGKTVEGMRQELNIVSDFTPEEEERLRQENAWVEEA